ncbi:peptidase family M3 [Lipomyces mesembrius]
MADVEGVTLKREMSEWRARTDNSVAHSAPIVGGEGAARNSEAPSQPPAAPVMYTGFCHWRAGCDHRRPENSHGRSAAPPTSPSGGGAGAYYKAGPRKVQRRARQNRPHCHGGDFHLRKCNGAVVDNEVSEEIGMIWMLQYAAPDMETQDASEEARKLFEETYSTWMARKDLFQLFKAAQDKGEDLDRESKFLLDNKVREYRRSGHEVLGDAEIEEYVQKRLEIDSLREVYRRNIKQDNGGVWFTEEELDGVPPDKVSAWKKNTGEPATGRIFVPLSNGGTGVVTSNAKSAKTRKKMYLGDNAKLAINGPIFEQIVKRRYLQAKALGYKSHASFRLEVRAVNTREWLEPFLEKLQEGLGPLGREELDVLQRRRIQDIKQKGEFQDQQTQLSPLALPLLPEVDEDEVAAYFPLDHTAPAMLGVFSALLGLRFDRIPKDDLEPRLLWHDRVQVFSVWDGQDGDAPFVGHLYFDLLYRENKYRHNQCVTVEPGYLKPDGSRKYPSTILMCAFPPPTSTESTLLKHREVVTMFHELGHGIHDLLSKTRYIRFHGYRLPPDFGEMPSMMLEEWCWMQDVLESLSCHHTSLDPSSLQKWRSEHPGQPDPATKIPAHLVNMLIERRYASRASYHLHHLSISLFDLIVHGVSTDEKLASLDIQKLWYDLMEKIELLDFSACRDNGYANVSFGHLIAGYDVGYYSYLCCLTFAKDLFDNIFSDKPYDRGAWERYRRGILEYGGSHPELLLMLEEFLGHPPNTDALIEGLGRGKKR